MRYSLVLLTSLAVLTSACGSDSGEKSGADKGQASAPTVDPALAVRIQEINDAALAAPPAPPTPSPSSSPPQPVGSASVPEAIIVSPFAVRAQVLLARAHFSSGVVDGQFGTNLTHAIAAYQAARGLPETGSFDAPTWQSLLGETEAGQPATFSYTVTAADIEGPYTEDVGGDIVKLAASAIGPQFATPVEALAERFHMSQALLKALNPQASFSRIGESLIVVHTAVPAFSKGDVARVDVSKSDASVRGFDREDKLVAFYPATVGSTERPSPSGTHKVVGVAQNADYTYDPAKLDWGPKAAGKLVIKPGPNNPVGTVWIDLNAPSYGLHGTPEPDKIGKTASHGCVRLTNWDAQALAAAVEPGATVRFLGSRTPPRS